MLRDLKEMAAGDYDLLVIGGGITGCCIAWDAALRGLRTILVEKGDFGQGTSSATSKLVHGGLRYLRNLEFSIVRQSLRERSTLTRLAPHLVAPIPFLAPVYGWGMRGMIGLGLGMTLYNALSFDRNKNMPKDRIIPGFKFLGKNKTIAVEPNLPREGLLGSYAFYDCQMHAPDRLTFEFIQGACQKGAKAANHARVKKLLTSGNTVTGALVKDELTGETHELHAKVTVNAAGPWADKLDRMLDGSTPTELTRSKGIHIVVKPILRNHAAILQTPTGRHLLMTPWRGHTIIGPTDTLYEGDPSKFRVTVSDIDQLLADVQATLPHLNIGRANVVNFYGGMRPLAGGDGKKDAYKSSRKFEILDHGKQDGLNHYFTVIGGKYTTSRLLAERLVNRVFETLERETPNCVTAKTPLIGHPGSQFRGFLRETKQRFPQIPPIRINHFCRNYGAQAPGLIEAAGKLGESLEPLGELVPVSPAEIRHAVRHEMAFTLEDVVFRRTGLATLINPGKDILKRVAAGMAPMLGWDEARCTLEINRTRRHFKPANDNGEGDH